MVGLTRWAEGQAVRRQGRHACAGCLQEVQCAPCSARTRGRTAGRNSAGHARRGNASYRGRDPAPSLCRTRAASLVCSAAGPCCGRGRRGHDRDRDRDHDRDRRDHVRADVHGEMQNRRGAARPECTPPDLLRTAGSDSASAAAQRGFVETRAGSPWVGGVGATLTPRCAQGQTAVSMGACLQHCVGSQIRKCCTPLAVEWKS